LRFGAAFLATTFLAAGLAAAFLRFGAAFLATTFLAAAFLRFGAAFLATAFLRRYGATALATAFLRFGADFLAAATYISYQNGSIRHRTCSRRSVTSIALTIHYFA
jgi:hypothetical protein